MSGNPASVQVTMCSVILKLFPKHALAMMHLHCSSLCWRQLIHIDGKSQRDGLTLELGLEVILSLHKKSTVHFA